MSSIIVASSRTEDARKIRDVVRKYGYENCMACTSISTVLSRIQDLDCGVVICSVKLSDGSFLDLYEMLPKEFRMLLMTGKVEMLDCPEDVEVLGNPLKVSELLQGVERILSQFEQARPKKKTHRPQRSAEEKQCIDQAKALLIEHNCMTEPEAYRYIQKTSMDSGTNLAETAQKIIMIYGPK